MSTISDEIEISDHRQTAEDSENSNHIDYLDSIDDTYDFKLGEKIQEKAEKMRRKSINLSLDYIKIEFFLNALNSKKIFKLSISMFPAREGPSDTDMSSV